MKKDFEKKISSVVNFTFLIIVFFALHANNVQGAFLMNFIFLKWISIPIIIAIYFYSLNINKNNHIKNNAMNLVTLLLIAITLLSFFYSKNRDYFNLIAWLLIYLKYILLFHALKYFVNEYVFKRFIKFLLGISIILSMETFLNYLFLNRKGDTISIIAGPYGTVAIGYILLFSMIFLFSKAIITNKKKYFLIAFMFVLVAFPGEIKALLIGAIVSLFIVMWNYSKLSYNTFIHYKYTYTLIFVIFLIFIVINYWNMVLQDFHGQGFLVLFDEVSRFIRYGGNLEDYNLNRISILVRLYSLISESTITFLFGFGPGTSFAGNFDNSSGISDLIKFYFNDDSYNLLNQFSVLMIDVGILGLLSYVIILIVLLKSLSIKNKIFIREKLVLYVGAYSVIIYQIFLAPFHDIVWRHDYFFFPTIVSASYLYYQKYSNENSYN